MHDGLAERHQLQRLDELLARNVLPEEAARSRLKGGKNVGRGVSRGENDKGLLQTVAAQFLKGEGRLRRSIGGSRDRARAGFARIWPRKAESRFKSAFRPRAYPKRLRGYPLCALPAGKLAGATFMARPPVLRRRCNLGSGLGTCPGAVSHIGGQGKEIPTCRNSPLSHALSP